MYQAMPLPAVARDFAHAPAYPESRCRAPEPVPLPWGLRPMGSARYGTDTLPDGRRRFWIRHGLLRGVTPRMLAWWFANLEGDVVVEGRRINRYRLWHPYDHVHASYLRRRADGSIGPGAAIRLKEMLGANPCHVVDIVTEIEKLDEEGYIHNPVVHGLRGLARMEYTFRGTPEGTLYENCLVFGWPGLKGRLLNPLVARLAFPPGKGEAWLRHNIEEVGLLEHFLPQLYRQETGLEE